MKRTSTIGYWSLLVLFKLIGWLPVWFLYGVIGSVVYFMMYRVFRYRVKVVRENLSLCFPEKTTGELRVIEKKFYRQLAEIAVDSIDISGVSQREIMKRIVFEEPQRQDWDTADRNWIGALAHYGSWEYFTAYNLHTEKQLKAVYKPLHNKVFDRYYNYCRTRFGMVPVAMHDILRTVVSDREDRFQSYVYGIIGDQTPPRGEATHWFEFLGRPTAFYMGVSKLALKFGMPVYFVNVQKLAPRRYSARFDLIYDGQESVDAEEITRRYVVELERKIREAPELWMWSHRRWKHKPKNG